jgi:hypothetical protein
MGSVTPPAEAGRVRWSATATAHSLCCLRRGLRVDVADEPASGGSFRGLFGLRVGPGVRLVGMSAMCMGSLGWMLVLGAIMAVGAFVKLWQ